MAELSWMVTITDRRRLPEFIALHRQHGLETGLIALGRGTATSEWMNYLGLDGSEKAVCFTAVTEPVWRRLRRDLRQRLRIDVPGVGVAFLVPMSSIGGRRELAFLTDGQGFEKGEESEMRGTEHELLVVVSNQGFNELVMDAARGAGAHGGTVIHARGTGMERAERFLGISLASEKEITFIVTRTAQKNEIMRAIMERAGMGTQAKSIVFSLPVTSTAGLRLIDEESAEAEERADAE